MAATAGSTPESQQFGNIRLGGKDVHRDEANGVLKLHADGVGWKSRVSGNVISIAKSDLRKAEWLKIPHAYQLRLRARGGFVYKYNGFRGQDKETVKGFLSSSFGLELEDSELSYKGWNWGVTSVDNGSVSFAVEDKTMLEMPLTDIAQATVQKNEAVLEIAYDDTALPEDELVSEVRFYIAPQGGEDADEEETTAAQSFIEQIKASGDLEVAGASMVTLDDLQVQVPRGRYDVELCDKFMKLHGKTNDYKVLYTNIAGLFLLPKQDGHHMALSVALEHPLRQGATSYPHVVFQLPRDTPLDVELSLTEAECSARFGEKLDKFESGDMPSVVAKVISAFAKRKVTGIKSGGFNADSKEDRNKSIRCSLKALDGFLFPLDKVFYFLSNKPLMIDLERVSSVEFNRVDQSSSSAAARTFDITVHTKDQGGDLQFVNLQRQDYKEFLRFLQHKKVRIKNFAAAGFGEGGRGRGDDEDDPYMNQIRNERDQALAAEMGSDDDDDDDEEDDDFVAGEDSDVDEEYSEEEVSGDDEAAVKKHKGKGEKKKKASSDASGSGSDDDGSSDDEKPAKVKSDKPPKASSKAAGKRPVEEELGIMGKSKKAKKVKKAKDPNAPKQAMSAYMIWMNSKGRSTVKETHPSASLGEIGKMCGAMWKEMGEEEKATWETKAKAAKEKYAVDLADYKKSAKTEEPSDDDGSGSAAADSD